MSELIVLNNDNQVLTDSFHNRFGTDGGDIRPSGTEVEFPEPTGWDFKFGNPEFWHYADHLIVPGGTVLDIGMRYGRSSMFFAMNGMAVKGLDMQPDNVEVVNEAAMGLGKILDFKLETKFGDALKEDLGKNAFDVVLLDHTLNHFSSKASALELITKAYAAVKPGGHIWVRAVGKEDDGYIAPQAGLGWHGNIVNEDVIEQPCTCSGHFQVEPTLFFGQTDLLQYFAHAGSRIVHSQLMPQEGAANVMFGEDYNRDNYVITGGLVTILAQKPLLTEPVSSSA